MSFAEVLSGAEKWSLACADCRDFLPLLPDGCIDCVNTDPPYEIGFMATSDRRWDTTGIAYDVAVWKEVLRVCKPGANLFAFGGTRTSHRTVCAIEDAGFEIRDSIHWIYGQGQPHGLNVAKAIDEKLGAEPTVVGKRTLTGNAAQTTKEKGGTYGANTDSRGVKPKEVDVTVPTTDEAKVWDGWNTNLKPCHEPIAVAQKPFSGRIVDNVLEHGTGAINVDACRISAGQEYRDKCASVVGLDSNRTGAVYGDWSGERTDSASPLGRYPGNLVFSHAEGCRKIGAKRVDSNGHYPASRPAFSGVAGCTGHRGQDALVERSTSGETVEIWRCVPWCPVGQLDQQSGERPGMSGGGVHREGYAGGMFGAVDCAHTARNDTGGASRFFTVFEYEPLFLYVPKATRAERERGLRRMSSDERENNHTTVKPAAITRWLTRLGARKGAVVLDLFAGSGTGGIAALAEGCRWIGCELKPEHVEIARLRIVGDAPLLNAGGAA